MEVGSFEEASDQFLEANELEKAITCLIKSFNWFQA
jgi:hypothetical protein